MKVSVIIPMYNSEKTILRAIESIKYQSNIEIVDEILIIDDGSTDNSNELVRNYIKENQEMPLVLLGKKNGGVSSARNFGMLKSNGDWIAFLDSDDEWSFDKLAIQKKLILDNPEIDFLGGPFNEKPLRILFKSINGLHKATTKEMCFKNYPQPSTVIFKKSIYEKIGGFDETQKYAEDGNYFVKICNQFNLYYYPQLLIVYDRGKRAFGTSGLSSNLRKMHQGNVKNIEEFLTLGIISWEYYIFLRLYYYLKFIRRVLITHLSKIHFLSSL